MPDTRKPPDQTAFKRCLHEALVDLYDPAVLNASPLIEWLGLEGEANKPLALRSALTQAIEALRPFDDNPKGAKSWRIYQILSLRYTGQWTQRRVADNIGLSERQLQREEKAAFEMLADWMWNQALEKKEGPNDPKRSEEEPGLPFVSDIPAQSVELKPVLYGVVKTLRSVAKAVQVELITDVRNTPPIIFTQASLLRQGLLNLLNQAIHIPQLDGQVKMTILQPPGFCVIQTLISGNFDDSDYKSKFILARKLIEACGGNLEVGPVEPSQTKIRQLPIHATFPIPAQVLILFVDDHADTLRLYQHMLNGTRYRFVGASTGRQGLQLAKENLPSAIFLDVMMPEQDGWRLLEQIRLHPKTQHIPVMVCSILPQEELAQALGAAGFLQKPVKQPDLLSALDRLTSPS